MFPVFPFSRLRVEHILKKGEKQTSALLQYNTPLHECYFLLGEHEKLLREM